MNKIRLYTNVSKTQLSETDTHFKIKGIPITADNAVMNGILYSAEENAKGMPSMLGQPLTLAHPESNGSYVSAKNGSGMQDFYSGGNITDVYNREGIWYADADVKKSLLAAQDDGETYINALKSKDNIGVSTGVYFSDNELSGTNNKGEEYTKQAVNQSYDHLAMLLNEAPAGGETTVMRFNGEDVDVVNVESLIGSVGDIEQDEISEGLLTKIVNTVKAAFVNENKSGYNDTDLNTNHGDSIMNRDEMLEALGLATNSQVTDDELKTLMKSKLAANASEGFSKEDLTEAVNAAVKPISKKLEKVESELTANKKDKLKGLREAVNKLDLGLPEVAVNAMGEADLTALVEKHGGSFASGYPTAVNARAVSNASDNAPKFTMPGQEA
tara:strand:- start:6110 stop:7264 length:1155 start_codon:yes stop_codon:yes gene_type:complete